MRSEEIYRYRELAEKGNETRNEGQFILEAQRITGLPASCDIIFTAMNPLPLDLYKSIHF